MSGIEKKNVGHKASAAVASLSVLLILLLVVFFTQTNFDRNSYLASCVEKHRLLESTASPRVILVGGSNLATGLDSKLLEDRLKRKVVNMGTCIQVGLGYMLREIASQAREGDTIAIMPEYEHWVDQFDGSKYLLMLPSLIPESISWIAPSYLSAKTLVSRISGDFPSMAQKRARHLLPFSFKSIDPDENSLLYKHTGFNQRGDFVAHLDLPGKSFDSAQPSLADFSHPNRSAIRTFNSIVRGMQARGAKIVYLPPVTTATFSRIRKSQLDSFYKEISAALNAQVIDDYSRYALSDEYFLDCIYHVRKEGRRIRTELVAADLNRILEADSPSLGSNL
ncbi:MAG: hypothetical protein DKT66_03765 [Candidatus Melainabacteria bacterium]|nr:MAG: hypothetical protein DKT66_03765 [Candidatus Melainabacteria bacterium]